jgi:hypothetical protein
VMGELISVQMRSDLGQQGPHFGCTSFFSDSGSGLGNRQRIHRAVLSTV